MTSTDKQVVLKGHFDEGGSAAVWGKNQETGRVEFGEYVYIFLLWYSYTLHVTDIILRSA